jgi:hypothetical protein
MEVLIDRKKVSLDDYIAGLSDEVLNGNFDDIYKQAPLSKDSLCGLGPCYGRFMQR